MGTLVEVTIRHLSDHAAFDGWAWSHEDGTLEAFWYEEGARHTFFFNADGKQLRGKKYALEYRSK